MRRHHCASRRWRVVAPLLLSFFLAALSCSSFLLLPSAAASFSAPSFSTPLLNLPGVLPAGAYFQLLDLLPGGGSREGVCGGSSSDCSLQVRVTQLHPAASSGACSMAALLQVRCLSQTDSSNFTQMLCVSTTSEADTTLLFPQDSPNYGFGEPFAAADTPTEPTFNALLSPARFQTMEAVAMRNLQVSATRSYTPTSSWRSERIQAMASASASSAASASSSSSSSSSSSALPVRILLLNQLPLECPDGISYALEAYVVHNAQCASYAWGPAVTTVVPLPGTNHTANSNTTIVTPGWNATTLVPCNNNGAGGGRGSCLTWPSEPSAPWNGNYTSRCVCDGGFAEAEGMGAAGCLVDTGADLSMSVGEARPFVNTSAGASAAAAQDPASAWRHQNNQDLKGRTLLLQAVSLNASETAAAAAAARHRPRSDWYARLNLSRALQDLSLVVHVTVRPVDQPSGLGLQDPTPVPPLQINFSPDFYPQLYENTPMGCLSGSDLAPSSSSTSASTSARTSSASTADDEDAGDSSDSDSDNGIEDVVGHPTALHVSSYVPGPSCWSLGAGFPSSSSSSTGSSSSSGSSSGPPSTSASTFKVLLHPPFLQGFLNRSGVGWADALSNTTLYFGIHFVQTALVDIRVWWQTDLNMLVPTPAPTPTPTPALNHNVHSTANPSNDDASAASIPTAAALVPSAASAPLPPSTASRVLVGSSLISANQSWVGSLLENELLYFRLNVSWALSQSQSQSGSGGAGPGPAGAPEPASLFVVVNDTTCVSGAVTQGWVPPHWWGSGNSNGGNNGGGLTAAAEAPAGSFGPMAPPLLAPGAAVMGLSGGCIRPDARASYVGPSASGASDTGSSAPWVLAGLYGQLYTTCAAIVELTVWHLAPLALDTRADINQWLPLQLNSTGSGCWRDLTVAVATSVPNDLLITVDQADAVILMRLAPWPANTPPAYPTPQLNYNNTIQQPVQPDGRAGGGENEGDATWQQHRIANADLSNTQLWYVSVYLAGSGASGSSVPSGSGSGSGPSAPQPPRSFRLCLTWATSSSFAHFSQTLIVIFSCLGSLAVLLMAVAAKMRCDACRKANESNRTKLHKLEQIRLMQAKQQDYTRM